ncbi:MAG: type II toxin-antitoxin system VapC family toxin [Nanoarchaeota archaeon]
MVRYCLDTGIVIAFFRNDSLITKNIENLTSNNEICISYITLCELYKGVYKSSNLNYELFWITDFINSLDILNFNKESCRFFGERFVKLQKEGKMVDDLDLMISSIAQTNNAILITRNKKDFENTGVKLEVW